MLKLIPTRPQVRRPRREQTSVDGVRMLYARITDERLRVEQTQCAVARGRHSIVEAQGQLRRGSAPGPSRRADTARPAGQTRTPARLAAELEAIHQRLLLLSSNVELEMDRLEVTRAEIERLTTTAQDRPGRR